MLCFVPHVLPSYFPMYTRKLNVAVKGNRALLLLLPIDVVSNVQVRRAQMPLPS